MQLQIKLIFSRRVLPLALFWLMVWLPGRNRKVMWLNFIGTFLFCFKCCGIRHFEVGPQPNKELKRQADHLTYLQLIHYPQANQLCHHQITSILAFYVAASNDQASDKKKGRNSRCPHPPFPSPPLPIVFTNLYKSRCLQPPNEYVIQRLPRVGDFLVSAVATVIILKKV